MSSEATSVKEAHPHAGTPITTQEALSFSQLTGVRAMAEVFPLERAAEAYDSMISGKVRFRAVLTTAC